jgi:hypothetical protein
MSNPLPSPLVIAWLLTACAAPQVDQRPRAPSPPPAASTSASASPEPAKPTVAEAKELASDEKLTVAEGVTVEAAKAWWSRSIERGLVLEDPERKLAIATLVVDGAADPASAVRAAWPRFQPKGTRTEKELVTPPTRDGWDAIAHADTPGRSDTLRVQARGRRLRGEGDQRGARLEAGSEVAPAKRRRGVIGPSYHRAKWPIPRDSPIATPLASITSPRGRARSPARRRCTS